jgi:ribosomal protein L10
MAKCHNWMAKWLSFMAMMKQPLPREIFAYQKKFSGKVNMLGGVFDNKFLNKSEIEEIALIPSLHVLRGMFVECYQLTNSRIRNGNKSNCREKSLKRHYCVA